MIGSVLQLDEHHAALYGQADNVLAIIKIGDELLSIAAYGADGQPFAQLTVSHGNQAAAVTLLGRDGLPIQSCLLGKGSRPLIATYTSGEAPAVECPPTRREIIDQIFVTPN